MSIFTKWWNMLKHVIVYFLFQINLCIFSHRVLSSTNSNLPGNSDFENIFIYTHTLTYILLVEGGQFSSVTQSCPTACCPMDCIMPGSLSITKSWSLLKLMSIESVMPSNHLILYHPLILLPSIFPNIRVFSNESVLHIRWPKNWSFSFCISPFNEYSGLISFRMDRLDLLAVQGPLKKSSPTPQFKSINSSALSLLHSPTLTSIHDYWINHGLN